MRFEIIVQGQGPGPDPRNLAAVFGMIQARPEVEVDFVSFRRETPDGTEELAPSLDEVRATGAELHRKSEELARRIHEAQALAQQEIRPEGYGPPVGQLGEVLPPTVTYTPPTNIEEQDETA